MTVDKEKKIAYLKFPADAAEVRKAKSEGLEIVDAIFAPKQGADTGAKGGKGGGSDATGADEKKTDGGTT